MNLPSITRSASLAGEIAEEGAHISCAPCVSLRFLRGRGVGTELKLSPSATWERPYESDSRVVMSVGVVA